MKKKLIIGIMIFLIGAFLMFFGIVSLNKKGNSENKQNNNPNENIYQKSEVIVFDFQKVETEEEILVNFTIYNNSNETIENMSLFIDFYEDSEKIYTSEVAIDKLEPGKELKVIDKSIVFIYDKITDLKFRFAEEEVPSISKEEYINKYGKVDANKIVNEEEDA